MGFFSHTNPREVQILIFRMLRNNADVRRCVYFELGLPLALLCVSRNIPLPCKEPLPFSGERMPFFPRETQTEINIEGMIQKLDIGKSVI